MDDILSIESVQPLDQLSFWCLTLSSMLKLIAMGVTIFALPFNEWVLLKRARNTEMMIMRGISGSDCVWRRGTEAGGAAETIHCVHWTAGAEERSNFWTKHGISDIWMEMPGGMHRALFSLVLLQLFLFLLDLGATLVMCCRYKSQKDASTIEKRLSLGLSVSILCLYLVVVFTALSANFDFTHSRLSFQSSLGTAFKLYCGMALLYAIGCALIHFSRLMALRQEGANLWKGFGCEGRGRRRQQRGDITEGRESREKNGRQKEEAVQLK